MRDLDETDRQILRLLLENGRRPFSGIAETVGLSPPAVSDRVDRLESLGDAELVLSCAACGRTVGSEGESLTVEGERLHFCSESCATEHREQTAATAD